MHNILYSILPATGINHGERKNLTSWEFTISPSSLSLKCLYNSKVALKFQWCFKKGLLELLPVSDNNYLMQEKERYPGTKGKRGQERKKALSPGFLPSIISLTKKPGRCVKSHSRSWEKKTIEWKKQLYDCFADAPASFLKILSERVRARMMIYSWWDLQATRLA